jgi:diguanylate cyclase (GGDEF)-like protein
MFKLLRYVTVVSFFSIGIAAALLGLGYRALAERDMVEIAHAHHRELSDILASSSGFKSVLAQPHDVRGGLSRLLAAYPPLSLMRVNAYDASGRLIYSSETEPQSAARFVLAVQDAQGVSELIADPADPSGGIVVSAIPLALAQQSLLLELHSNVGLKLDKIARTQKELVTAAIIVLGLLYGALVMIVVRGDKIIRQTSAEKRAMENRLRKLSRYDLTTGLPSRETFHKRLQEALIRAQQEKHFVAVLFFDLDQAQGRPALYEVVAKRILEAVRKGDTVCRIGADFAVLLGEIPNRSRVSEVTEKIVHALREEFSFEDAKVKLGSRAGISLFPVDATNAEMLMRGAELALKYAKQTNEFVAYYQPRKMLAPSAARQPDFSVVGEVLK